MREKAVFTNGHAKNARNAIRAGNILHFDETQ